MHLRPSWYCASHCWVPGTPSIALTNIEASAHRKESNLVLPDSRASTPVTATADASMLAIRFVDHPAHQAAHQTPQGYAPKLSESAGESSGVPLVARLRRWLLRRGLNDFGRQAVPRVDATKPRQWLQKLLSEIPSQFDELVDTTRPCRWLMNRRGWRRCARRGSRRHYKAVSMADERP